MNFIEFITQDWSANKSNPKGRIFMLLFRVANFSTRHRIYFYFGLPYIIFYKLIVQWLYMREIPWNVTIGRNFAIYHGQAIIINKDVVIGDNCTIRHCVTLGTKQNSDGSSGRPPRIGNNVDIGCNVCIIGDINVGDNVKIGSGSVVVRDIAPNCIAVGNPAVEKKKLPVVELVNV